MDLSVLAPLAKDPTTPDEEWTRLQELGATLVDPDAGAAGSRAAMKLEKLGRPAYPIMVNAMLQIDLTTYDGHRMGDFLQKTMQNLLSGKNMGWKYDFDSEPNKTAIFNKKVVRGYHKLWENLSGSDEAWEKLTGAKATEKTTEETTAEETGLDESDLDDLDDLDDF